MGISEMPTASVTYMLELENACPILEFLLLKILVIKVLFSTME